MNIERHLKTIALCILCLCFTACSTINARLAKPYSLIEDTEFLSAHLQTEPFILQSYYKLNDTEKPATIYIEGDGLAWISRSQPSGDPTPEFPTALELALVDKSDNVFYIARPCQYTKDMQPNVCDMKYWTSHRFSGEVIESYNQAITELKAISGIESFHLVGYSGGGAIATLLASQREDILSLRTIAGNLDHNAFHTYHGVSMTPDSLNPIDYAHSLKDLPQTHYVGENDDVIVPQFSRAFIKSLGSNDNARQVLAKGATHDSGWRKFWKKEHINTP